MSRPDYLTISREELDILLTAAGDWLEDAKTGLDQGYYENEIDNMQRLEEIIAIWSEPPVVTVNLTTDITTTPA